MSWFQSTNLASFAKTALKEAQKTIDKALDISEEEDASKARTSPSRRGKSSGAAAVGSTVTDMASDFFSSWGVGNNANSESVSPSSSQKSNLLSGSSSNESNVLNSSQFGSSDLKSSVFGGNESESSSEIKCESTSGDSNVTANVPVSLLVPSTSSSSNTDIISFVTTENEANKVVGASKGSNGSGHTRSLSDTVFHANDDSDQLGDLVKILDDTPVVLDRDRVDFDSSVHTFSPTPNHIISSKSLIFPEILEDNVSIVSSESREPAFQSASTPSAKTSSAREVEVNSPGGIDLLLHEICLNTGNGETEAENELESNKNVIFEESSKVDIVSSSLSDGWDWPSKSESCSVMEENSSVAECEQSAEQSEIATSGSQDQASAQTEAFPDQAKEQIFSNSPTTQVSATVNESEEMCLVKQTEQASFTPSKGSQISSFSSRPSSPVCHGQSEEGESSSPSSARVSPNFEIVATAGGQQMESSRSSSIVVVSGQDSTQNSRGTSGAGSSGSSEGGHDIADEVSQSPPAAGLPSHSPTTTDFHCISKTNKAASSCSSSDIEVIPTTDFSASTSTLCKSGSIPLTTNNYVDRAVQTHAPLELKDSQIQTEEGKENYSSMKSSLDPSELSKLVSGEVADILHEKEQEVQQLREEGEKLSVKQFELGQVIKKLRAKEKETEGVIKGLRTEIATKNLELEKLMKTFISKEGIEQSQNETILKLNQERGKLELKVEQLHSELEDARDNVESMKATVENASIEILELKNVISSVQRESAEVDRLTRDKGELTSRTESLQKEVDHLRSTLNSSQSSHHSREAALKSEISNLTQKIHQLENHMADVSSEIADATMPLSMEIEKLQGELKQQTLQADRREHIMLSTISDLELKLSVALEREQASKELQIQYQSQHSTFELRIEELETQNQRLTEQLLQKEEIFKKKMDDKAARCQKLEKNVERLTGEVERLSNENDLVSNELKAERHRLEVERRRNYALADNANRESSNFQQGQSSVHSHRHHQNPSIPNHQRSSSMSTTASSTGGGHQGPSRHSLCNDNSPRSREHSPSDHSITSEEASYLEEVFDPNTGMMIGGGNNNRSMTPKSFFESFTSTGLLENLQSQLRLREGEVFAFQDELTKNEKIRKQLNEEIANLTMHNQQLGIELEKMGEMQHKIDELDKNYNAVLQMYGEKVEEADELRMDLDDVKEMYKAQIEQLLKKS